MGGINVKRALVFLKVKDPNSSKEVISDFPGVRCVCNVLCEGSASYNLVVEVAAETLEELKGSLLKIIRAGFVESSSTHIIAE